MVIGRYREKMRRTFGVVFLSSPPSLPTAVLRFWFLCGWLCFFAVFLCTLLDTYQLVIIGIAVSCSNGLVNYFQEIARLLALEEATLSTDLQQGYALKSLTGIWWHRHKSCSRIRDGVIFVLLQHVAEFQRDVIQCFTIVSIGFLPSI